MEGSEVRDESTFRLVRGVPKLVWCPSTASRYDSTFIFKTIKHTASVIVWSAFSGKKGRAGMYFLSKNVTMKGSNFIHGLKDHMLAFWRIHQCNHFMHDGTPVVDSLKVSDRSQYPRLGMAMEFTRPEPN